MRILRTKVVEKELKYIFVVPKKVKNKNLKNKMILCDIIRYHMISFDLI